AYGLHRRPRLFPVLAVAAVPFRVPIESGGATVNLLVPLYFVIGAGALAWLVPRLGAGGAAAERDRPRAVAWALMGLVVLYAVQASYGPAFSKALEQVVFFYVPFAILFALLARVRWDRTLAVRCFGVLVGLALAFAAIGFVEYATREVLFNPKVIRTNEFASYFRVNSLFFDPNIYGRFLDVAMIALTAALLWAARRRDVLLAALALAVLWGALLTTLSQSSFAALLVGLAVLAVLRYSVRATAAVVLAGAVVALAFVLLAPGVLGLESLGPERLNEISTGRVDLVEGGAELFADRPAQGWGAGSFSDAFEAQDKGSASQAVSASHTIPLTVAAEQGAAGLVLYLAVVVLALVALLRGAGASPARAAVGAAFCALLVHTLLYAAFLEDPMTWTLLGVGLGLVGAQRAGAREAERAARRTGAGAPREPAGAPAG
ncbi:MAG TPA: O-antigen ligase family protein, partial [Solirubrobacteraceae bacterium]|nr:O-antigen ligase family protein [Solirubrobacteraceae bacterium]